MALIIEKVSDTKIWIHDGSTSIMELDTSGGVRVDGSLKLGTNSVSGSTVANAVAGTAQAYKISRSAAPVALDGSNPTSVAHGLTTCEAAFAQLVGSAAPGDSTMLLTAVINGANIDVYAWKHTDGTDPTLVASTGTETFNWFAVGT
jgi:hypothetical protein